MELSKDKIENSYGTYIRGVPNSLPYPELIQKIDEYRKNVCQRLIPLDFGKIPKIQGEEIITSVKADGEYSVFYYDNKTNDSFFCNAPTHRLYMGLPVNQEMDTIMKHHKITSILVGGELIGCSNENHDFNARCRVYDLIHYSRNPQSQDDLERIGFKAFDILEIDGKTWMKKPFRERYNMLTTLFSNQGRASMVESITVEHVNEIEDFFKEKVEKEGHEGIVIRTEGAGFKVKPVHTIDVAIIGISPGREGTRLAKDQLATALVALRKQDGTYQILTRVGGGLTDAQRKEMWQQFTVVASKGYVHPTRDGRIFELVKPELVGQIYYSDILTDTKEEPIIQNILHYNEKESQWEFVKAEPFIALISPRFVEKTPLRADKIASNIEDVRISQITEMVEIPDFQHPPLGELPLSTVLARKVYERGDDMVRKFILWQTNKEHSGFYARFNIYHLDYSENRKNPLTRNLMITNDEDQAWNLYDSLVATEMIGTTGKLKRGWSEISLMDSRPEL